MAKDHLTLRSTISGPEDFDDFSLPSSAVDAPPLPRDRSRFSTALSHRATPIDDGPALTIAGTAGSEPGSPVSDVDGHSVSGSPLNTLPPGASFARFHGGLPLMMANRSGGGRSSPSIPRVPVGATPMRMTTSSARAIPIPAFNVGGGSSAPFRSNNTHLEPNPSPLRAITFPAQARSQSSAGMPIELTPPIRPPHSPLPVRASSTPPDTGHPRPHPAVHAVRSASFPAEIVFARTAVDSDSISIADPNPPPPYTRYPTDSVPKEEERGWRRGAWRILNSGSAMSGEERRGMFGLRGFFSGSGRDWRRRSGLGGSSGSGNGNGNDDRRRGGCGAGCCAWWGSKAKIWGVRLRVFVLAVLALVIFVIVLGVVLGTQLSRKNGSDLASSEHQDAHSTPGIPNGDVSTRTMIGGPDATPTASDDPEFPYLTLDSTFIQPLSRSSQSKYPSWGCVDSGRPESMLLQPPMRFPLNPQALWSCDIGFMDQTQSFQILRNDSDKTIVDSKDGGAARDYIVENEEDLTGEKKSQYLISIINQDQLSQIPTYPNPPKSLNTDELVLSYLATTSRLYEGVQRISNNPVALYKYDLPPHPSPDTPVLFTSLKYNKLVLLRNESLYNAQQFNERPPVGKYTSLLKQGEIVWACMWEATRLKLQIRPPQGWDYQQGKVIAEESESDLRHGGWNFDDENLKLRRRSHPPPSFSLSQPTRRDIMPQPRLAIEEHIENLSTKDEESEESDRKPSVRCRQMKMDVNGLIVHRSPRRQGVDDSIFTLKQNSEGGSCKCRWVPTEE